MRDLDPVFAELARVLRPGGTVVLSDSRAHLIGSDLNPSTELAPGGE